MGVIDLGARLIEADVKPTPGDGKFYFCECQYSLTELARTRDSDVDLDSLYCENMSSIMGTLKKGFYPCNFSVSEIKLDANTRKIFVVHDCSGYRCTEFKPANAVLSAAEKILSQQTG